MQFEMKTLQQNQDKVTTELKSTQAQLDARNRKYASIEGAKSEQMKGEKLHCFWIRMILCYWRFVVTLIVL